MESRIFQFEGKQYEVRVGQVGDEYKVRVFQDGKPANGYTYSANVITDLDMKMSLGFHAFEHLMDVAESDVRAKYWERYLEAVQKLKAAGRA